MPARLRYRGHVYQVEGGNWRGPDGHIVHLLTWVTDDLWRQSETTAQTSEPDLETARRVAERLGEEAEVISRA